MIVPSLSSSERTSTVYQHQAHIRNLKHIRKTTIFSDFKINSLITGSLFTTSTIKWQWHLYFMAYTVISLQYSHSNQLNLCLWYSFVYACGDYEWNVRSLLSIKTCHACIESSDIWIFFAQKKYTYTNTHLGSPATLYTFYKIKKNQKTDILLFIFLCL